MVFVITEATHANIYYTHTHTHTNTVCMYPHPPFKTDNSDDPVRRFSSSGAYWKTKESINIRVSSDRTSVEIHWNDESKPASFHAVWLRWQCWCSECRDGELGQTLYSPGKLGNDYVVNDVTQEGSDLVVKFGSDENHLGRLPLAWLKRSQYGEHVLNAYRENT